jgi:hypothetical protein
MINYRITMYRLEWGRRLGASMRHCREGGKGFNRAFTESTEEEDVSGILRGIGGTQSQIWNLKWHVETIWRRFRCWRN